MSRVTIYYVGDIVGPTSLTIDDMPDAMLAELRGLRQDGVDDIVFLEGVTPTSDGVVGGRAIKIRSITRIEVAAASHAG